jgi:hypothetical protein
MVLTQQTNEAEMRREEHMQRLLRFRAPAVFCALAMVVCELMSSPYTTAGLCDDAMYIRMAKTLADTGHIVYNGWGAGMMVSQLYLGAAFIKLFGFSFTTVRMSTLLVAGVTAFVLQRTLVRAGVRERNATIGTLAVVLSPVYLMISATFMTDISGTFAIVVCLYGCLRALQASTDRSTIAWLCFAVATNALWGSSRQIAWLGVLVMVPCTLWLLRSRRRVLLAGAATTFAGAIFILACLHWLKIQPYTVPVPLLSNNFSIKLADHQLGAFLLDVPFLLLPIVATFLPEVRKCRPRTVFALATVLVAYILIALHHNGIGYGIVRLEPTSGDWVNVHGIYGGIYLHGSMPIFLNIPTQVLLTVLALGGVLGIAAVTARARRPVSFEKPATSPSWKQLSFLLVPFTVAYILLLIVATGTTNFIFDRYGIGLFPAVLIVLIRCYQERVQPRLPLASAILVAVFAVFGIVITHNNFAIERARVALANELHAHGVPDTSIDNGWEYNLDVELQHANHINLPLIQYPANAYVPTTPLPAGTCDMLWPERTPHIRPLYAIAFNPNACYGLAPFTPVHYSRWPYAPGTLYVVRALPAGL